MSIFVNNFVRNIILQRVMSNFQVFLFYLIGNNKSIYHQSPFQVNSFYFKLSDSVQTGRKLYYD